MHPKAALSSLSLFTTVYGQQVGTQIVETHPPLTWQRCTGSGCTQTSGSVVLDANWRWIHVTTGTTNCYTGNTWNSTVCPDGVLCTQNCALDGADYSGTYGITTSSNTLTLRDVGEGAQQKLGSRVYLMASDSAYQMFKPLNQEFTFDVDVSNLPCGLNGAVYFSEMDADGGISKYPNNKAGAKYGTGYCDSQCPKDLKFINGEANVAGWTSDSDDANSGTGSFGSCCNEMDVWEANSVSATYAPHPCSAQGQTECTGTQCGGTTNKYGGICDPDGCDFNSYRMGNTSFYGKGNTVDTNSKFTVVTQFLTNNNSTTGTLSEIRRLYVQNGRVIQNSKVNIPGLQAYQSITDTFCTAQKTAFGDTNSFSAQGGLTGMGKAFAQGMVLVMSLRDDRATEMLWLDGNYPITSDPSKPGVRRGTCAANPVSIPESPGPVVVFSNIKFGDIGSTYNTTGSVLAGGTPSTTGFTPDAPQVK